MHTGNNNNNNSASHEDALPSIPKRGRKRSDRDLGAGHRAPPPPHRPGDGRPHSSNASPSKRPRLHSADTHHQYAHQRQHHQPPQHQCRRRGGPSASRSPARRPVLRDVCDLSTTPTVCRVRVVEGGDEGRVLSVPLAEWMRRPATATPALARGAPEGAEGAEVVVGPSPGQNAAVAGLLPGAEMLRLGHVARLRERYERLCRERIGLPSAPRESFNRWLFERRLDRQMCDPLIPPHDEANPVSRALRHEIVECTPYRPKTDHRTLKRALADLRNFTSACDAVIEKQQHTSLDADRVQQYRREIHMAKDTLRTVQNSTGSSRARWQQQRQQQQQQQKLATEAITRLKAKVADPLRDALKHLADDVCSALSQASQEALNEMARQMQQLRQRKASSSLEESNAYVVKVTQLDDVVELGFEGHQCRITPLHFQKLFEMYKVHQKQQSDPAIAIPPDQNAKYSTDTNRAYEPSMERDFNERLFVLLQRYETFFGNGKFEGTGFQAALPSAAFRVLTKEFGVAIECFASPLNCHYLHFCSAFKDTDAPFGSMGSFFDFEPTQGCFEANPPFTIEVMDEMVTHIENLLSRSGAPLSFIVFVPTWEDAPPLKRMDDSKWLTHRLVVEAWKHGYINGAWHRPDAASQRSYAATHPTTVYFLQNDAGHEKWPPEASKIDKLKDAFQADESN